MRKSLASFLLAVVTCIGFLFGFAGCKQEDPVDPATVLSINVPDTTITAMVGEYELADYYVINGYGEFVDGYTVVVSGITDPDGMPVSFSGNSFRATGVGVYEITYTTDTEDVEDAILKVEFFVPAEALLVDLNNSANGVSKFISDSNGAFMAYKTVGEGAYVKGNAEGSLKYVITQDNKDHYIRFNSVETLDITMYNYVKFSVYNDSDCKAQISFGFGGYTILQPNAWTDVCIDLDKYDGNKYTEGLWDTDSADGLAWSWSLMNTNNWNGNPNSTFENIAGCFIRIRKHESVANDADGKINLYFSSIYATLEA